MRLSRRRRCCVSRGTAASRRGSPYRARSSRRWPEPPGPAAPRAASLAACPRRQQTATFRRVSLVSRRFALIGLLVASCCAACGGAGDQRSDPDDVPIARVGERPIARRDFDGFLVATLGGPAEIAAADAVVKSRLLDQYLEDELLAAAAIDAGIQVSAQELKDFQPSASGASD